ncbi:MAG: hypothetical protein AB8B73_14710 [Ekhidna sp.]
MRTSVDSVVYTSGAQKILVGELPEGREIFYTSYMLLLAFLSFLNIGEEAIIYVQFAAAITAIFCSYKLSFNLTGKSSIALLAPILYVLWFKFQQWNLVLYTDALFSHMVIISIYALVNADNTKKKLAVIPLIIFTCFIRPTGFGLLLAAFVFLVKNMIENRGFKRGEKMVFFFVLFLISVLLLNAAMCDFVDSFLESYQVAEVIYPKIQIFVDLPSYLIISDGNYPPLVRLSLFIIQNPIYFLKLSVIKGALFLGHIKPYYSTSHNVLIGLFLYPTYLLAVRGYLSLKDSKVKWVLLTFILFQFLTVCMTSENWDGRFLLPVLPPIFILSSLGANYYLEKVRLKTSL